MQIAPPPTAEPAESYARLAPVELLALMLLARGYGPEQIAQARGIDSAAVQECLARAAQALGARTAREAVVEARRRGLID